VLEAPHVGRNETGDLELEERTSRCRGGPELDSAASCRRARRPGEHCDQVAEALLVDTGRAELRSIGHDLHLAGASERLHQAQQLCEHLRRRLIPPGAAIFDRQIVYELAQAVGELSHLLLDARDLRGRIGWILPDQLGATADHVQRRARRMSDGSGHLCRGLTQLALIQRI
jgi:hypothetical protein